MSSLSSNEELIFPLSKSIFPSIKFLKQCFCLFCNFAPLFKSDWSTSQGFSQMVIRCAEFFSGIGGMHYGIQGISEKEIQVIAAFDINQIANTVYAHNFGLKPITMNIE